jgi:uncharacterized membrane protein
MGPIHPAIVHFPIALLVMAAVLHVLAFFISKPDLRTFAFWLHLVGTVTCVAAILSGDYAEGQLLEPSEAMRDLAGEHETLGMISGWGFGVLAVWAYLRKESKVKWEQIGFVVLFVLMTGILLIAAQHGGELVYEYGAGVSLPQP